MVRPGDLEPKVKTQSTAFILTHFLPWGRHVMYAAVEPAVLCQSLRRALHALDLLMLLAYLFS